MSQSFWQRGPKEVAESLLGLSLVVGGREAIILGATPYPRSEQQSGLYKPMLDMEAGSVYCPKMMASILLCIVTGQGQAVGSCVRIDDIELGGERRKGPGKTSGALGLTAPKATGTARVVDACVEIEFDSLPAQPSRRAARSRSSGRNSSGIGEKALARLLPGIAKRYLADDPPVSFEGFLDTLLKECRTEAAVRQRLGL